MRARASIRLDRPVEHLDDYALLGLVHLRELVLAGEQLEQELLRERVHLLGPVEGEAGDAAVRPHAVDEQVFEGAVQRGSPVRGVGRL